MGGSSEVRDEILRCAQNDPPGQLDNVMLANLPH